MTTTNFELPGAEAVLECLNALSGDGEIAKGARRGASVMLFDVVARGLAADRRRA